MKNLYKKEGKEMSKENQESFPKVGINWLITIYPRTEETSDKIRDCGI